MGRDHVIWDWKKKLQENFDPMNPWLNKILSWHHLKLNKLSLQNKYIQEVFQYLWPLFSSIAPNTYLAMKMMPSQNSWCQKHFEIQLFCNLVSEQLRYWNSFKWNDTNKLFLKKIPLCNNVLSPWWGSLVFALFLQFNGTILSELHLTSSCLKWTV